MLNQSILLEINPQLGLLNELYQDTTNVFRDSSLSNYIQIAASDVFHQAKDKSLFSLDIEALSDTVELRLELASGRHNYLRLLNLDGLNHALDLSEDLGGVAHFLASRTNTLDSVKIDTDRSRLSILRCANKPNICHISEDLDKLRLPVSHYDLIVLGSFEALKLPKDRQADFLTRLQASLSERGVLIINVQNRHRISNCLDTGGDHSGTTTPYMPLYLSDYDLQFDRKQLLDTLALANFACNDFYATFSKGEHCQNLFSEDYLTSNLNALNHFYRLGAIDNPELNEYLFFRNLVNSKQRIFDLASRFIVFSGASSKHTKRLFDNDFSHFTGTTRKPQWRTITERKRAASEVHKTAMHPGLEHELSPQSSVKLSQNLAPQPFQNGRILVAYWLDAILNDDSSLFQTLVDEFADWLAALEAEKDFTEFAYDLLPFNVIVGNKKDAKKYQKIDTEWKPEAKFGADFVMFRTLFWFAFENKAVLRKFAEKNNISSIAMFVLHYLESAGQIDELKNYIELEEKIQTQINHSSRANSLSHALLQSFSNAPLATDPNQTCQIMWGNSKGEMDESNSIHIDWQPTQDGQKLAIKLSAYNSKWPVLRVDPIAGKGMFCFSFVQILDQNSDSLWQLGSSKKIAEYAEPKNLKQLSSNNNEVDFIALNDDPYLLFNLSKIKGIKNAQQLVLNLNLLHDANYDAALTTLSHTVDEQNLALVRQASTLNRYRADLEYSKLRIVDVTAHRTDLNDMLQQEIRERKTKVHELNNKIRHLNDQLVDQLARNHEMEGFLMMRPSTRIKRFAARSIARLTGKSDTIELESEITEDENIDSGLAGSELSGSELPDSIKNNEVDPNQLPSVGELIGQNTEDYQLWITENTLDEDGIRTAKKQIEGLKYKPVFSILVPVYNVNPDYLIAMIRSAQAQIYPHWQLCMVDDASPKKYLKQILEFEAKCDDRISIQLNDQNKGISLTTNDALAMATGDYICLLDHDDEISIDALLENAKVINQFRDVGLIYSDEDKMDMQGNRLEPYFKPDYSPDLLETNNYICHFTVIKKAIVDEIGGFREGLDGSQDHDIILRAIDKSSRVVHIPKVLYHWRKIPGSTAVVYDSKSYAWEAGRKAIENLLQKKERGVRVDLGTLKGTYRVFREIVGEPLVSIIIPFKDKPELLDSCLSSILNRTTYQNFEIIGVSNNSEEDLTFQRMKHFKELDSRVHFVDRNIPFNFSALCNYGVEQAKGEYVLLLNNDIEIISPDWIERLLEHAQRPNVGAVGGKLLYPDQRIQHAGVVVGMVGAAGHPHKFFPDNHIGYHGRLHMVYNVSAVTGAMLMISKEKFNQVNGLDDEHLAVAYNDIDFCLKLLAKGYLNIFTPHCKATHFESTSRGYEDTNEKIQRLHRERDYFLNVWKEFLEAGDPYYNPNLSLKNERFSLNFRD